MRRALRWTVWGLVVAVALVWGVGAMLPEAHVGVAQAEFSRPPAEIFATVSDVSAYPAWWPEVSQVEMLPAEAGRVRFRMHLEGPVVMEVVESAPPARFVTRIADPGQPFGGTWTYEIEPAGTGSRLTITERGEIYSAPFRFFARFVFGYTATIESCLAALARRG
ncbi:MAG: SRPBCC domain-containing protein [Acidobacteriota bacterium]